MERIRKLDGSTSYSLFCDKVMASTLVLDPVIMCANSIDRNYFFYMTSQWRFKHMDTGTVQSTLAIVHLLLPNDLCWR